LDFYSCTKYLEDLTVVSMYRTNNKAIFMKSQIVKLFKRRGGEDCGKLRRLNLAEKSIQLHHYLMLSLGTSTTLKDTSCRRGE
jgi:hypothetical protein